MGLKQEIEQLRKQFAADFPPDQAAVIQASILELEAELESRTLPGVGVLAPDFELPDARGRNVRLSDRLANGPAILSFYRGGWCPYCNLELRAYQRRLPNLRAAGADLIAVSPQTPDGSLSTADRNGLEYDVLSDAGSAVAAEYGIAYSLPGPLRDLYLELGTALPAHNGTDDWQLPIPATFVIAPDRRIVLSHVVADYRDRLEPDTAIEAVRNVAGRWPEPESGVS